MPSLTDVKDVVTIISLLVASSVALAGLNAWKKQTIARIEYDLARRIIMTVYQLREAIHVFRNPGFEDEELTAAETGLKKDNSDLDIKEVGQRKAAYRLRWNPVETALRDLLIERLEAEATWGKQGRDILDPKIDDINLLHSNLEWYIKKRLDESAEGSLFLIRAETRPADFEKVLRDRIEAIEKFLTPKLRLRS